MKLVWLLLGLLFLLLVLAAVVGCPIILIRRGATGLEFAFAVTALTGEAVLTLKAFYDLGREKR